MVAGKKKERRAKVEKERKIEKRVEPSGVVAGKKEKREEGRGGSGKREKREKGGNT